MDLIDKTIEDQMKAPDHNKNTNTNNQKPYVLFYKNITLQLETTLGKCIRLILHNFLLQLEPY